MRKITELKMIKELAIDFLAIDAKAADSAKLNGITNSTAYSTNTIVQRDGAGDIFARLFRTEYADQNTMSGAMAFRINNSTDNYTRFCSDKAAIRTWLDVPATSHTHNYLPLSGGTMTGDIDFGGINIIEWHRNTDWCRIAFKNNGDSDTDSYMHFTTGDNGDEYFKFSSLLATVEVDLLTIKTDALRFKGNVVLHTGNCGTVTAGRSITPSQSAPSSPSTGDVWIFY